MSLQRDDVCGRARAAGGVVAGGRGADTRASGSWRFSMETMAAPYDSEHGVAEARATVPARRGVDRDDSPSDRTGPAARAAEALGELTLRPLKSRGSSETMARS